MSGYSNAYIVDGDEGVTLIDTGMPKNLDSLTKRLAGMGRSVDDITTVVITHGHVDHFGSAAAVVEESRAKVVASAIDAPVVRGEKKATDPPFMDRFRFLKPILRLAPTPEGVPVAEEVSGDQAIGLVSDLRAIQTPGHTPGHMSLLLDRGEGILFVGDAAVSDRSGSVKRGFMNLADPIFDASLRRLASHSFQTAYFGHSAPIRRNAAAEFQRFVETI